jgi:hypothetical protein
MRAVYDQSSVAFAFDDVAHGFEGGFEEGGDGAVDLELLAEDAEVVGDGADGV